MRLQEIVGKNGFSSDKEDLLIYPNAKEVIWPASLEELQKIVRWSFFGNVKLIPIGGYSDSKEIPKGASILDFSKLKHLELKENEIIAQAGCTIKEINDFGDKYDIIFPWYNTYNKVARIGGIISRNALSPWAHKFGKLSDWISIARVIRNDGKVMKITGEEAIHFSEGIIAEVSLKTVSSFKRSLSIEEHGDIDRMVRRINYLLDEGNIFSIELIDKYSSRMIGLKDVYHLFIEFEGESGDSFDEKEIEKLLSLPYFMKERFLSHGFSLKTMKINELAKTLRILLRDKIPLVAHIGAGVIEMATKGGSK